MQFGDNIVATSSMMNVAGFSWRNLRRQHSTVRGPSLFLDAAQDFLIPMTCFVTRAR